MGAQIIHPSGPKRVRSRIAPTHSIASDRGGQAR
jgi:hypothetical protein